jgi:tetratricopeptide (TPR) repeat protein
LLDKAAELAGRLRDNDHAIALEQAYVCVLHLQERYRDALQHAERLWELIRNQSNPLRHADAFLAIARQRIGLGSPTESLPLGEQALAIYREIGHRVGQASAYILLGYSHRRLGQYDRAIQCFEQSLALERALNDRYWEAHSSHQIGDLYHLKGDRDRAAAAWKDAAATFEDLHHPEGAAVRAKLSGAS